MLRPTTCPGSRTSTRGSRAARWKRAFALIPMPGQITPPAYSPRRVMTSKVVAVPKSTTTTGPPWVAKAATPLRIRSAPTSPGGSYRIGIPVFIPGSTTRGSWPRYWRASSTRTGVSGGTTLARATPSMLSGTMLEPENRLRTRIPYSSAVCSRRVVSLQCTRRSRPSNRPRTVFVLPTSMVRSMPCPRL